MTKKIFLLLPIFMMTACMPFGKPRDIDWREEWRKNGVKLKALTQSIKLNREPMYQMGNNDFPNGFKYPFNQGFYIGYRQEKVIDTNKISIKYYLDRGLAEHYSAFIYTKNAEEINELESNVLNGGNDYKIEDNWYIIND